MVAPGVCGVCGCLWWHLVRVCGVWCVCVYLHMVCVGTRCVVALGVWFVVALGVSGEWWHLVHLVVCGGAHGVCGVCGVWCLWFVCVCTWSLPR